MKVIARPKYKIQIEDKHCNVCGKEIHDDAMKYSAAIRERMTYGSTHDDEEHSVRWCEECLVELITKQCEVTTKVMEFSELSTEDYDGQDLNPAEALPGNNFCNKCGKSLTLFDINSRMVIQAEFAGRKYQIRFCQDCFDDIIDGCEKPSLIKYWDNESHLTA